MAIAIWDTSITEEERHLMEGKREKGREGDREEGKEVGKGGEGRGGRERQRKKWMESYSRRQKIIVWYATD